MKIVKLTFNFDWPLFRQTPNYSQVWGNYKFVIDENLKACDYWIIYCDYQIKKESVKCPKENIIFIPGECYNTSPKFSQQFLNQFGAIITVQKELKHKNIIYSHNANPWFVNKNYDELLEINNVEKNKLISVITSNKTFTQGHKKRLEFVKTLKHHFGDKLDVYGRGINDFNDKWDVLAPYKYTITIENDNIDYWVTEKFFDCMLSETLPLYYGCPNLETFINKDALIRIDINNVDEAIRIIESAIKNNLYEKRQKVLAKEKIKALQKHQFFPWIVEILEQFSTHKKTSLITLKPNKTQSSMSHLKKSILKLGRKIKNKISHIIVEEDLKVKQDKLQFKRCQPWFQVDGDNTLRLNYNLNKDSLVFDLGGYKGEFAQKIFSMYKCELYIFEPVQKFYQIISDKFKDNSKINAFEFGLSGENKIMKISDTDDSSSVFINSDSFQEIQLKSIVEFINQKKIQKVDLIKINIEGGEYEVLEALLDTDLIKIFKNIQVQFHDFILPNAKDRMLAIQKRLQITHELTYEYEFVWENWKLKE